MNRLYVGYLLLSLGGAVPHLHPRAAKYEGFQVFRVETGEKLNDIYEKMSALDYQEWNQDSARHMDFSLPPDQAEEFKKLGIDFKEMHRDLGQDIAQEGQWEPWSGEPTEELPDPSWYDTYHDYEDHLEYLNELVSAFPNNSETFTAGKSLEDRDQQGIHLFGRDGPGKKPAILWHGTIHAREWITTMTVEYITYQLIDGYGKDDQITSFLDDYDFYIIPIVNPDGFVWTQSTERLWRKNRTPPLPGANESARCWGIDLNRNYPHEWNTTVDGSSPDPCSEAYRGASPGDAPEMDGLAGFADKLGQEQGLKLFIDFHSYSQLILSPWGYTCDELPPTSQQHVDLMGETAAAIEAVHGTSYEFGPTCTTIYPTNGGSMDYIYDITGAEWSMAFELRDTGEFGFILPPEQIVPTCEETFAGVKLMLSKI